MGLIQEFKEFAVKGNAMDMAVGIIIGAAFSKIVTSMVNDLIMPPIGLLIGGVDFKDLKLVLKSEITEATPPVPEVAIRYGNFFNLVIEFAIIAFSVFMVVKVMNRLINLREKKAALANP